MGIEQKSTPEEIVEAEVRNFNILVWDWHDKMVKDLVQRFGISRSEVEDMVMTAMNVKVEV